MPDETPPEWIDPPTHRFAIQTIGQPIEPDTYDAEPSIPDHGGYRLWKVTYEAV